MTMTPDIFKVCIDRCPEAYGNENAHEQTLDMLKRRQNTMVEEVGCLGICSLIGRPAGGVGNFIEESAGGEKRGLFVFNERGKVTRLYLEDIES